MHEMEGEKNKKQQSVIVEAESQKSFNFKSKQRMISCKATDKVNQRIEQIYPAGRMHHSSIVYRNKIYIWGGSIEENNAKNHLVALYVYQLENKRWKKFINKAALEQVDAFIGQCHTVINNRWYLFGGVNINDEYVSQLWKLNLDTYQWVRSDQKNDIPNPSQGGCLVAIEKNWLLHYQGFNSRSISQGQHIYIYSNDSKNWHCCEGNYQFIVKFRIGTSMCQQNGKVYMFGGATQQGQNMQYLNDFYELSIQTPNKYSKAKVDVRIIRTNPNVASRNEHFLFPIQKNYICLIGGRNNIETFSQLWIYNIKADQWYKDSSFSSPLLARRGLSCAIGGDQLYLFGGMADTKDSCSYANDLWSVKMQWDSLNVSEEDSQNTDMTFNTSCSLCYQKRNNFVSLSKEFCSTTIKDLEESIEFPFSAFGLLMDNCLMHGANQIQIQFETDINNEYFIKIQDNGKNTWSEEQFLISITHFCSQNNSILIGTDKKIRKSIIRNNLGKQFGVNIKLGGFRLGKRILYISIQGDLMRVCSFYKSNFEDGSQKWKYIVYYYSYDIARGRLTDQQMRSSQQQIDYEYKKFIREAMSNRTNKNVLYIFETCINDHNHNLFFSHKSNDLWFGNLQQIQTLQQIGYNTAQSIDISLKAYLSSLYLKNQSISILMGLRNSLQPIHIQCSLDHIDKLCKAGASIELDGLVQFDFKIAEFYYLRDLKPHQHFFSNGVLLYYKNRLITRYKVNLGEMTDFLLSKHSGFSNYLPLFGFAELPQNIPLNVSKTAFAFTLMMEKMQSRLKFVDESFKERSSRFLRITQLPYPRNKVLNYEDFFPKSKRSIVQLSNEREIQSKKRYSELGSEQPVIKKKLKKREKSFYDKIQGQLDFVPPTYQLRQIQKQLKKERQMQQQIKQKQCILIEHIEQSQQQ